MRPLRKYAVGETIVLDDGTLYKIEEQYKPYQKAKGILSHNFGQNCVYCEASYCYKRDLNVEHILPKDPSLGYSHLEFHWDNFLLSCATCNGSDNKATKVYLPNACHYPHLNNTFLSLKYDKGGVVVVNPNLRGLSYDKAKALLELVGLDKSPKTSKPGDTRWQYRKDQWDIAEKYKDRYMNGLLDIDCLIEYVMVVGCWSIWFTVFDGCDEVRKQLIERFPGTAKCFDENNHYNPVERNPDNVEDPV